MYKKDNRIETPPDDTTIWKYMDLWKFLDLIDSKELYLHRIDLLEDKFEGRFPFKDQISDLMNNTYDHIRIKRFTTCFTKSNDENYAMWKIYTNPSYGIAIKTNINKLIKSLNSDENDIIIGNINYKESRFILDSDQVFKNYFIKKSHYKYENEVRLLTGLKDNSENLTGLKIKIDLKALIDEIYISPFSTENFKNLIELKLKEINIDAPLKKSNIYI